ncbi:MAG: class I SAM-dependent RNA methyltransferase [Bryobacterales bacterium]|nr:class I SAM-dependent RNA methyltransferase [Bryobacterales bacterium]
MEKLVYGGAGLARLDGQTALIPYVLPGEQVTAEVVRESARVLHGKPVTWQAQSKLRIPSKCPIFLDCGGCHYQHIPYEAQLEFKTEILRETLARLGKIEWTGEIETISAEPWGYRNRTQLRIFKRGRRAEVGFLEAGSHRLVPATDCPINSPKLNEAHVRLRELVRDRRFPAFLDEMELFTNEQEIQLNVVSTDQPLSKRFFEWLGREIEGLLPGEYLDYPSGGDVFRVGSRSFFQVNRFLTDRLAQAAVSGYAGKTALDLYSGVGLLTLPLARTFEQTIGVDSSGAAVRSLQFNADRAGVEAKVVHLNVNEYLRSFNEEVDLIVADPPRAGLGADVVEDLVRIGAPQLSLVSCDPSTLARDLRKLLAGGYAIESIAMADLFPQTYHLETVVRLAHQ